MRHAFLLLLAATTLLISSCSSDGCGTADTPEAFGEAIFKAVQENDWDCYNAHTMTEADARSILKSADLPEIERAGAEAEIAEQLPRWQHYARESFDLIMKKAKEKGIEWADATLDRVDSDHELEDGVNFYEIRIYFTHGEQEYGMKFAECYGTESGIRFNRRVKLK